MPPTGFAAGVTLAAIPLAQAYPVVLPMNGLATKVDVDAGMRKAQVEEEKKEEESKVEESKDVYQSGGYQCSEYKSEYETSDYQTSDYKSVYEK
jgi:hypothetical protein